MKKTNQDEHSEVEAHDPIASEFTKPQFVRKHEQADSEPEKGGEAQRTTKASRVTLGRHITSDSGAQVADRRHKHIKTTRTKREKENFGK